jgi:phenol/toluene 2-monooxygenase (NADH) P1/A1
MQIDIKAKTIKPIRQTYTHVARRIGEGKPATRYQEAVFDIQATEHFHYRPTWQPDKELYDASRTALVMEDWYSFLDPRQYYYGTYCIARAKQQDSADRNFKTAEKRGLIGDLAPELRQEILDYIVPLRHFEWGANMNNTQICAMGYGTAITSTAIMNAADRLGNAQYITRIALLLGDNDPGVLEQAKTDWTDKDIWQGLRKVVEDTLVVEDWFELFVAQNLVLDGLIHPIFFDEFDRNIAVRGGSVYSLMTEFIFDWDVETRRWSDKQIQVATSESPANKALVSDWFAKWLAEAETAIAPLVGAAFANGPEVLANARQALIARARKSGVDI